MRSYKMKGLCALQRKELFKNISLLTDETGVSGKSDRRK